MQRSQTLWIIVITILLIGLIYAFDNGNLNQLINTEFVDSNGCPDYIIPNRIAILEEPLQREFASNWKDGESISAQPSQNSIPPPSWESTLQHSCRAGSQQGENIHYFYCDVFYDKHIQNVNPEGDIVEKGKINYNVQLILKPEGNWTTKDGAGVDSTMLTQAELEEFEKGDLNLEASTKILNRNGIYQYGYKWVYTKGEVWVTSSNDLWNTASIYRNYSIVSAKCVKQTT